jgi:ribosomal-protein-alanine N-acetyltransferase
MPEPPLPTLRTDRLLLRPFTLDDAPEVARLAGDRDIGSTTLNIPHPYPAGEAERWISSHEEIYAAGREIPFAIATAEGVLLGGVGLRIERAHHHAELGYWIGKPYWGRGYGTEAAAEALRYGFEILRLHRIHAGHFSRNPTSGRVLLKLGMTHEGHLRQHILKWGVFEDTDEYGILRSEYEARITPR